MAGRHFTCMSIGISYALSFSEEYPDERMYYVLIRNVFSMGSYPEGRRERSMTKIGAVGKIENEYPTDKIHIKSKASLSMLGLLALNAIRCTDPTAVAKLNTRIKCVNHLKV